MWRTSVAAITVAALTVSTQASAQQVGDFRGRLWVVSEPTYGDANDPPPSTAPDATFTTHHVSFWLNHETDVDLNNSVSGFLNSANLVHHLAFSGVINPLVGAPVGPTTPVTSPGIGLYIKLGGHLRLTAGQIITLTHDDGAVLRIDGVVQGGIASGSTPPVANEIAFSGTTGIHSVEITYLNSVGSGLLSFEPAM